MKKLIFTLLFLCSTAFAQQGPDVNYTVQVFPSQTFTASTLNSNTFTNLGYKGGHLIVNISAWTSGTVTVTLQGFDGTSGQWYTILQSPALSTTGTSPIIMKVYPGATILGNYSTSDFIPIVWRVQLTGASTPSMTLSVGFNAEY